MIDTNLIINSLPALLRGMWVTIQIASISCTVGLTFGTLFGIMESSQNFFIRFLIGIYTTIIRGTPMLIQILFIYFILPQIGIRIPVFWSAVTAISLNSTAYISQIIRSGISSVNKGQIEAAQVLGLNTIQITRYIILPQAIRVVLPALGNEFITLVKDSSLASIIDVVELSRAGKLIISRTHDAISIYCIVALLYLVMTTSLSIFMIKLEQRMNRHVSN